MGPAPINEYNYYINCKFEITADKNLRIKRSPTQNVKVQLVRILFFNENKVWNILFKNKNIGKNKK